MVLARDFDLLLCEIMLSDVDGLEIIRAVKAQAPQLPVLVLTSADPEGWRKSCEDAGAALFISKPVLPTEILREVSMVEKARLNLRVALIDTDGIHRTRLTKTLRAIGCSIRAFASTHAALEAMQRGEDAALWVIDASDPEVYALLKAVQTERIPVFAFGQDAHEEEKLMRAGAALFLPKPIDIDTLLTQASFLAR